MNKELDELDKNTHIAGNLSIVQDWKKTVFVGAGGSLWEIIKQGGAVTFKRIMIGGSVAIALETALEALYGVGKAVSDRMAIWDKYEPLFDQCDEAVEEKYRVSFRPPYGSWAHPGATPDRPMW